MIQQARSVKTPLYARVAVVGILAAVAVPPSAYAWCLINNVSGERALVILTQMVTVGSCAAITCVIGAIALPLRLFSRLLLGAVGLIGMMFTVFLMVLTI
jgi:hypothetical protein